MKKTKREVNSLVARGLSFLLLLNGLWVLFETLIGRLPDRFDWLVWADAEHVNHQIALLAGLGLVYFSLKLRQGKRNAWYMTIAALALFLQYALLHPRHHIIGIISSIACLVALVIAEGQFNVKSDTPSFRKSFSSAALVIIVAVLYGTIGFAILDRKDFRIDFNPVQAASRTIRQYSLIGNSDLHPHTRQAKLFLDSLNILGLGSAIVLAASIFRPVRFALGPFAYEYRQAEEILNKYSRSPEDYLKLWPTEGKHLFFNKSRDAFIGFTLVRGVVIALDDAAGKPSSLPSLISEFIAYSRLNGWMVSFAHCGDEFAQVFEDNGMEMIPIGQEAVIDVARFVDATASDKHFRYNRNKFTKLGVKVAYLSAPQSEEIIDQLEAVSDDWLRQSGRKERTFALGYFDADYISGCDVCVAYDEDEKIVAFTNMLPVFRKDLASIDLLRYRKSAAPGIMNFVFLELINKLHEKGVKQFNLGFSPLSGIESESVDNLPVAALRVVKQLGGNFFSFDGLEQFKGKFRPDWEKRYIAYEGGPAGLLRATVSLLRAMKVDD